MNLNCTWREMMREAGQRLAAAGIENPARNARLLLAHALGVEPVDVLVREIDAVDPVALTAFEQAIQRRLAGEPVSRIRGWREFYGRRFVVTPDVLDPRPETELLVGEGLKRLPRSRESSVRVLDLGTGSGCILVSVLAEWPDAAGVGVDISAAALAVARQNARALRVADRASFIEAGWTHPDNTPGEGAVAVTTELPPPARGRGQEQGPAGGADQEGVNDGAEGAIWSSGPNRGANAPAGARLSVQDVLQGAFDLVLSNPPYVGEGEIASLAADVRAYDPRIALTPGEDALAAHRAILQLAPSLLKPGGWIGLEFGQGQHDAVRSLMANAGLVDIAVLPDLAGIPRAAFGRRQQLFVAAPSSFAERDAIQ